MLSYCDFYKLPTAPILQLKGDKLDAVIHQFGNRVSFQALIGAIAWLD
jgi:hypothetical protein